MKRYYIQLKKNQKMSLLETICTHLKLDENASKKLIIQGSVWHNNKRIKDHNLIIDDTFLLQIFQPEFPIKEYSMNKQNIKYEDEHLIIINKEAGVNTCPSPFSDTDCLSYGVQKYFDEKKIDYQVFTINRLDKPTKGLVFFAKNKKVETLLHQMFKERDVKKLYLAITPKFDLKQETFFIRDFLEWKGKSQDAISYIKFTKEKNDLFYFTVYPKTGRTHQIRKHFQKYLIPLIGDATYGNYSNKDELGLTCFYYRFKHPVTNKKMEIKFLDECK